MFTLIKNSLGNFDLYANGFLIDDFSIQRDYMKLQSWDEQGKLYYYDLTQVDGVITKEEEKILNLFKEILKGAKHDPQPNS